MFSAGRRTAIAIVYGSALIQGLTLVSFPASSSVLRQMHGFTDSEYGAIFLPQVALAVLGALLGGQFVRRIGLKALLLAALAANVVSQVALTLTSVIDSSLALSVVLVGTGAMGFGFGLLGAPMNGYPALLFPERRDTAIVMVHTLVGIGLGAGPLAAGWFVARGSWPGFPVTLSCLALATLISACVANFPATARSTTPTRSDMRSPHPARGLAFWLLVAIAVLYAFAEGTFSNWIVIYLQEGKGLAEMTAALALSVFWGALVAGRLFVSFIILRVSSRAVWMSLPALMTAAFLLLPYATGPVAGVSLFALAGIACSAFFPLTVALASSRFPDHAAWVSSMLIAALMSGVGLGSFFIGPLRSLLSFERLYQLSSVYPVIVLGLALLLVGSGRFSQTQAAQP